MTLSTLTGSNPNRQNSTQSAGNLNNLLSTSFVVCTLLSLTAVLVGFILLGVQGIRDIQPSVRLDQLSAAITIHWGVLALILTPVIQIIIASVKFLIDRDKVFTGVSLSILAFLGICFALALL